MTNTFNVVILITLLSIFGAGVCVIILDIWDVISYDLACSLIGTGFCFMFLVMVIKGIELVWTETRE